MDMKKILLGLSCALAHAAASAGMVLPNGVQVEELTGDALWGCQVFLCLANPNGPKAVAECVPPIDRLIRECFKPKPKHRRPFPTCPQAGAGNRTRLTSSPWDPCELKGMTAAKRGWIAEGRPRDGSEYRRRGRSAYRLTSSPAYHSQGEEWISGEGGSSDGYWTTSSRGTMACVRGNPVGTYREYDPSGENSRTVTVYEEILWQKAQPWTAVDVYIDGRHWNRTHFSW